MATWVRSGTGTAPTSTDAALTGRYSLDNGTAPGDFGAANVTSVQIAYTITGSGFAAGSDYWDDLRAATLDDGTNTAATVNGTDNTTLRNTSSNTSETDSSPNTGLTTGNWEAMAVSGGTTINGAYTTWVQDKGKDGGVQTMSALTVTITYTPASNANVTATAIAATAAVQTADTYTPVPAQAIAATSTVHGFPGYILSPDSSTRYIYTTVNTPTGDLEIILYVAVDDWTAAFSKEMVSKWTSTTDQSFRTYLNNSGKPSFYWSDDGTTTRGPLSPGTAPSYTGITGRWFRFRFDVDNGASESTLTTDYSDDPVSTDPYSVSWTNIGSQNGGIGVTSVNNGSAQLQFGHYSGGNSWAGKMYTARVTDGFGGTVVASPDARYGDPVTDAQGNTWSKNGVTWVGVGVSGSATVTATALTPTSSIPTPTVAAGGTNVAATAIAATSAINSVTVSCSTDVTATAAGATTTLPPPTVSGNATVTATAIAATSSFGTQSVSGSATVTAAALTPTSTVPTPTVTTGANADVTATAIAVTSARPTPTVTSSVSITATALSPTSVRPTPTVTTTSNANVSATAIAATSSVPSPTVAGHVAINATAVAATHAFGSESVSVGATITAVAVAVTSARPTPTVTTSGDADITATAIAATATLPSTFHQIDAIALGPYDYGVDESLIGPSNEPAETTGTQATTANYTTVIPAASPGDTILLRAGTYSSNVTVPSGTSGNPITVKPYNQEAITFTGRMTLGDYNIIAGITFSWGTTGGQGFNIGSTTSTARHDIELRYNTFTGGEFESIRLKQNVTDVRIHHNDFNGGASTLNHCMKSHWESSSWAPTNIEVDHNVFSQDSGGVEDGLQIEGWGYHHIHHNNFRDIAGEDGLDIKAPHIAPAIVLVEYNDFDGSNIAGGLLLAQGGRDADTRIFFNQFAGNKTLTLGGDLETDGYTNVQWNRINLTNTAFPSRVHWRNQTNSVFRHNYVTNGNMRMGNAGDIEPVDNLLVADNRFDGSNIQAEASTTIHGSSTNNDLSTVTDSAEWSGLGIGTGTPSLPNQNLGRAYFGTPTVTGSATVSATAVAATVSVPSPGVSAGGDVNISATAIAVTHSIGSETVSTGSTVAATTIAATHAFGSESVSGGATVSATAVASTHSVGTPTVSAGSNANISATAVAATHAFGSESVSVGVTISAVAVAVTHSIGTPTVTTANDANITATAVAATTTIGTPSSISGGATVTATARAAIAVFTLPIVSSVGSPTSTPAMTVVFYRSPDTNLVWSFGSKRSMTVGFKSGEGFEQASDKVKIPVAHYQEHVVEPFLAAAWAANKAAPIATLRSAINDALNTAGYRAPGGGLLPT